MENDSKSIAISDNFDGSVSLYEATCAKVLSNNGSKEEHNLEESMKSCKITPTKVQKENTDSKEERNYEGSMESNTNTSTESSAESQQHDCDESMELVEITSEKVLSNNGSKEEHNLEESMESCEITPTKVQRENTDSIEGCYYERSWKFMLNSKEERDDEESMDEESNSTEGNPAFQDEPPPTPPVELVEVTSERKGAKILYATDDCYGVAENLLKDDDPVCNIHTIFDNKTNNNVDGWKTRKTRNKRHNFVIIQLAARINIHSICIDTACFTDISQFSIQGGQLSKYSLEKTYLQTRKYKLGGSSTMREYTYWQNQTQMWDYLIPTQDLSPGYPSIRKKIFKILPHKITHLRLNIFPDGGIARLRAYGELMLNSKLTIKQINLMSSLSGTKVISFGELCIGHPSNIIQPNKATSVIDGWETARKENYDFDEFKIMSFDKIPNGNWASFKLGRSGVISRIVIDTSLFSGNAPYMVRVQGFYMGYDLNIWKNIIPDVYVKPGTEQNINVKEEERFSVTNIKISLKPDGGISRFRIFGIPNVV